MGVQAKVGIRRNHQLVIEGLRPTEGEAGPLNEGAVRHTATARGPTTETSPNEILFRCRCCHR